MTKNLQNTVNVYIDGQSISSGWAHSIFNRVYCDYQCARFYVYLHTDDLTTFKDKWAQIAKQYGNVELIVSNTIRFDVTHSMSIDVLFKEMSLAKFQIEKSDTIIASNSSKFETLVSSLMNFYGRPVYGLFTTEVSNNIQNVYLNNYSLKKHAWVSKKKRTSPATTKKNVSTSTEHEKEKKVAKARIAGGAVLYVPETKKTELKGLDTSLPKQKKSRRRPKVAKARVAGGAVLYVPASMKSKLKDLEVKSKPKKQVVQKKKSKGVEKFYFPDNKHGTSNNWTFETDSESDDQYFEKLLNKNTNSSSSNDSYLKDNRFGSYFEEKANSLKPVFKTRKVNPNLKLASRKSGFPKLTFPVERKTISPLTKDWVTLTNRNPWKFGKKMGFQARRVKRDKKNKK